MRNMTKWLTTGFAVAGIGLFGVACSSTDKTDSPGANEHPSEHPSGEHPSGEHPSEHPSGEHPSEHPQ